MKVEALLHSMEDDRHSHKQEKVIVEVLSGFMSEYQTIVRTPDGKKCTAIFNPFVGFYYADDVYGIIERSEECITGTE